MRMSKATLLSALKIYAKQNEDETYQGEIEHYIREIEAQPPTAWVEVAFDAPFPSWTIPVNPIKELLTAAEIVHGPGGARRATHEALCQLAHEVALHG